MNRYSISFMAFVAILLLNITSADISCQANGICSGSGNPGTNVRCRGCQSCTYKGCCHVKFTDKTNRCPIPGWKSTEYKLYWTNRDQINTTPGFFGK